MSESTDFDDDEEREGWRSSEEFPFQDYDFHADRFEEYMEGLSDFDDDPEYGAYLIEKRKLIEEQVRIIEKFQSDRRTTNSMIGGIAIGGFLIAAFLDTDAIVPLFLIPLAGWVISYFHYNQ